MVKLVEKLKVVLEEKGKTFQITGKELMEELNVTVNDLFSLCEKNLMELYDIMYVETSTKYARKFKEVFEFPNEVCWYEQDVLDPKYITVGMSRIYKSCDVFLGDIFKKGTFAHYSISLKDVVNLIRSLSEEDEIKLSIQYFYDDYIDLIIKNKEIVEVRFTDIETENFTEELKKILLYQLMVLSYDVPLIETLEILQLVK